MHPLLFTGSYTAVAEFTASGKNHLPIVYTMWRTLQMALLLFFLNASTAAAAELIPASGTEVVEGDSPHIQIRGLLPGEQITVHLFRTSAAYRLGDTPGQQVLAHSTGRYTADKDGNVSVDTAFSSGGTYVGVDSLGLLWSGNRMPFRGEADHPVTQNVALVDGNDVLVRLERRAEGATTWSETRLRLTDGSKDLSVQDVSSPGVVGVFARPRNMSAKPLSAILILHGSEGGTRASARAAASRFARLGYAAFAVIYFAWPGTGVPEAPQALMNIPVETLAHVRSWLMQQPNVDASTVAVWGVSKGAEFALVGASQYPWIDRVVACVPSSVVWTGFGRALRPGETDASWTVNGKGLPGIDRAGWDDVNDLRWTSAFVHQRALGMASEELLAATRIPVERIRGKMLLLAADKDVVWPSATMTQQIENSLRSSGHKDQERSIIFPNASHYICGTGSEIRRVNPVNRPEGDDPSPEADAHAAANGWSATRTFLKTP